MARGTVVVTGASTGIGEATATLLAAEGFDVFAGVRNDADAERLRSAGLKPLTIDVTDQATIDAAVAQVTAALAGGGLHGLVNNAGIAVSGPLEHVAIDDLRRQLEVNLIGQVAVIQGFLPLIRAARGRIVNVSSIGGRIALPLAAPYAASKYALEAISDSLRREVRDQGIEVVLIEPGGVKTPIWDKGISEADELEAALPAEAKTLYGGMIAALRREVDNVANRTGIEPSEVGDAIAEALTARKPKTRYLVGRDAKLRWQAAKRLPDRTFDALIARALR